MSKNHRKSIRVKTSHDVSEFGHITKKQLLNESEKYDQDNYNPIHPTLEKDVLVPNKKSDVVTIRLTPQENELISSLANENGLSKSAYIRMVVKRELNKQSHSS